jgi:cytochrome P450
MFTIAILSLLVAGLLYYVLQRKPSRCPDGSRALPGPPGVPILGVLPEIPPSHSWFKFQEWSKQYGPLYRMNIASRNHVVVSTEDIANDLLRERGTIYSDREQLPMAAQLVGGNLRPLFLPYGETWRNVRKTMHSLANVKVATSYEPLQEEESLRMLRDLGRAPEKYETWFERYSAGLILRLAYSKPIATGEELFVRRILGVVHNLERVASPGAYLVDTLPSLMNLPAFLAPFKREGARLHAEELDLFRGLLQEGIDKSKQTNDPAAANFCGKWHENKDNFNISFDHAAYTIGTLFEAGAGTTAATMMSFMLAMTLHPAEFKALQAELDRVVGPDRLPSFSDMPDLPRVRAIAKETLRWRPVTAGGLPHQLTKDDVYKLNGESYFLPAGTNVHPVQWSIHREEARYPDPDSFRPERWLEAGWPTYKEPLEQFPNLQNYSSFGFGRRICPGLNIAERSLYIGIAMIAWGCEISQKIGPDGKAIVPPDYDYVSGFNVRFPSFAFMVEHKLSCCAGTAKAFPIRGAYSQGQATCDRRGIRCCLGK